MEEIRSNQIKIKEHLGIVTSDASTLKFSFFVTPLKGKLSVEERNYVLVPHPTLGDSHPIIAEVVKIKNYEEVVGTTLNEKAVHTTAVGKILGYVESKKEKKYLRKLFSPPTPGSKVYIPYLEFIEDIFKRNPKGKPYKPALFLGTLESMAKSRRGRVQPVRFYLDGGELANQHILISAMSGAGKTQTATVLIEELANKTSIPIVIFDPNSEYLKIGERSELNEITDKKKLKKTDYLFDFQVSTYADELVEITKFIKSLSSSRVTIINSKTLDFEERQKLSSSCLKILMEYRIKGKIEPFILVIENDDLIISQTLESLFTRSRKIGICTILLTQHPSELNSRVLSQMDTQILGRTINQQDLLCLTNMVSDKIHLLPKLRKGEWIINGINLQDSTKVLVRETYSLKTL